jgi:hypothetical protein
MADFGSILADFKAKEEPENIVPLVEDEVLRQAVVAWKSVSISYKQAGDCGLADEAARWNWMWQHVEFDQTEFGIVAGVKAQDVTKVIRRMIGLRLIYPDGTIAKFAKQYLQMTILSKLKPFQPKETKKPEPKPEPKPEVKDA